MAAFCHKLGLAAPKQLGRAKRACLPSCVQEKGSKGQPRVPVRFSVAEQVSGLRAGSIPGHCGGSQVKEGAEVMNLQPLSMLQSP